MQLFESGVYVNMCNRLRFKGQFILGIPLEMAECFKTGPCIWGYIMVPQVICLPMVCRGEQNLAGERLWHGSMRG